MTGQDPRQQRIVTITVNPALDVAASVSQLAPERKLRCDAPTREAGGGGVNVARAIHALGGNATACLAVGGATGDTVLSILEGEGVGVRVVRTREWTRENVNIVERATGNQFRFCMPGPRLADAEWQQLIEQAASVHPEVVVLSGSLTGGVPADFYVRAAKRLGGRIIVDTSGDALLACRGVGVHLVKASLREFAMLVGATRVEDAQLRPLAAQAVARGVCEVLVVSLGPAGALWTTASEQERLVAPVVPVRSSVGAGDTMVAGIALALARGGSLAEAMRYGVAAGSATVMRPATALCRREDVEQLLPQVRAA
ncbi:MAG: 1-phosphofructokinase family hexose kinase [Deltaproteobacteria bacterium]|nr:1-phosphofructokinase family hexose kinase [Deltaproteobacteria bacterium]